MTTPSGLPLKALQFWGTVRGTVANRGSTADVWTAINSHAANLGLEKTGLTLQSFNQLRSAAVSVRNSGEAFTDAPGGSAVTGEQIGLTPYARPLADRNATPQWLVGFTHITADDEGNESEQYRTVRFTGQLPPTKQDLLDAVEQDAEALADQYNSHHVGTSDHEVLAI